MKIEFKNIRRASDSDVFFLYGNYKKSFHVFCDFVHEKLLQQHEFIERKFVSIQQMQEISSQQYDLFDARTCCYCIRNVEDSHLAKLEQLIADKIGTFVLECGDFTKSKKITDYFTSHKSAHAIASFKNDITMRSICKMMLPSISSGVELQLVNMIRESDEDLSSFFQKITLLLEDNQISVAQVLSEYSLYRNDALQDMDVIPFIRYVSSYLVKKEAQIKSFFPFVISDDCKIADMLNLENYVKNGALINKHCVKHCAFGLARIPQQISKS